MAAVVVMVVVVDIVLLLTHNLSNTEEENTMKYKNLTLEIKNTWKFNTVIIYLQSSQWKEKTPKTS